MIKEDPLAKICTPNRLIRETYYSSTYRAKFSINKTFQYWDVTRISIPFSDNKEKELLDRLGLLESDKEFLISFYELFAKHIKTGWKITKELYKSGNSDAAQSFPELVYNKIYKDDENGNIEIYTATDSLDPLIGSKYISDSSVSLLNLLQLAARFTVTLQKLAESGIHIGALDLDSIGLTLRENEDDKTFIRFSSLLYGTSDNIASSKLPCLPSIPGSVPQGVLDNTEPITIGTDAYNLCGIIWSVCNGEHYTTPADFSRIPRNIPESLIDLLASGCKIKGNDANALKQLRNGFFALIKNVQKGKIENITIKFNPVPFWKRQKPQEQVEIESSSEKDSITAVKAVANTAATIKEKSDSELLEQAPDTDTKPKESAKITEAPENVNQTESKTAASDSDIENFSDSTSNENIESTSDEPVPTKNVPEDVNRTNALKKLDISGSEGITPNSKQSDVPATVTPDVSSDLHNIPIDENSVTQTETEENTDIPASSITEPNFESELVSTPESEQQFNKQEPEQLKSEREPEQKKEHTPNREPEQNSEPEPEQKLEQKIAREPEHELTREPEQKPESNVKPESVHELAQNKPTEQPDAESYPDDPATSNSVSKNNSNSKESSSQSNVLLYPQEVLQQNNNEPLPLENFRDVSDSLFGSTGTVNQTTDTTEASNIGKNKNVEKPVDNVNSSTEQNLKETEHNADISRNKVKSANTAFPDFGNESLQSEDKHNGKAFDLDSVSLGEVVEITVRPSSDNSFKKEDFIQEQNKTPDVTSPKSKAGKNEKPVKAKKRKDAENPIRDKAKNR